MPITIWEFIDQNGKGIKGLIGKTIISERGQVSGVVERVNEERVYFNNGALHALGWDTHYVQ